MTTSTQFTDSDGISYKAMLPLSWSPVITAISSSTLSDWMDTNIYLLRALTTMETLPAEKDNEMGTVAAIAFERLETKVDLALTLLATLLEQKGSFPNPVSVNLSANAMEWIAEEGPSPNTEITLSLYLSKKIPQAIIFPAKVTHSKRMEGGLHTRAEFINLSEEMQDWLERTLFRYHRREIQLRHSGKTP
ncbi:PilZ domain-containing protein [Sulfurirhabdus autotrophica]|uniref:PilZ domain-containing protein n=1 Tax=Sulfurirhabdus autotrophica TaxID=1706046 RepID=A0A4R3YDM4_9PROT|nr:PilZ domain-containing protein [Sulfurirhabdus autotrophica]TCV90146.1 PilZ domain-containing protein [Sulfurirhabdus autotrophica]